MKYFVIADLNNDIIGLSSSTGRVGVDGVERGSTPGGGPGVTVHEVRKEKWEELDEFQADDGDGRGLERKQIQYDDAISQIGPRFRWDAVAKDFSVNARPTVPTRPPVPDTPRE